MFRISKKRIAARIRRFERRMGWDHVYVVYPVFADKASCDKAMKETHRMIAKGRNVHPDFTGCPCCCPCCCKCQPVDADKLKAEVEKSLDEIFRDSP